ncbi:recombinase XerC [Ktedonobacteria bacterium brp13]|nr:recombinase XerC [Ktedonobacteria bacterium brp13]
MGTSITNAIADYLTECQTLQPKTYQWYEQKLAVFSEWCAANDINLADMNNRTVTRFQDHLSRTRSPRKNTTLSSYTVHGYVQVVKGFANWCAQDDEYEGHVSEKAVKRIKPPKVDVVIIETFTQDHIKELYKASQQEYNQHLRDRDELILDLFLNTGIRSNELCTLTVGNIYLHPEDAHIKVYGKGRKWREVGLPNEVRRRLRRYLEAYRKEAGNDEPAFASRYYQPLTIKGIDMLFDRLARWGKIEGVRCSAHTCRHTFAVNYLRNGGDIYRLSILMGHSSVKVTEVYLKTFQAEEARKTPNTTRRRTSR